MKETKEQSNNRILKYKGCNHKIEVCNNCFYNNDNKCFLGIEITENKCILKDMNCRKCDYYQFNTSCQYIYLKEQYDKLELMKKILK